MEVEIHIEDCNAYDNICISDGCSYYTYSNMEKIATRRVAKKSTGLCFYFYFLCHLYSRAQLIYC